MEQGNFVNVNIPKEKQIVFDELKEKYNPEGSDMRNYQNRLLQTLVEFDDFCNDHGIYYSIAYGTMLGAVRQKGFIPWDDDVDIFMDRDNYVKLEKKMKGEFRELTPNIKVAIGIWPELWSTSFAHIDISILDNSPDNIILKYTKQLSAIIVHCLYKATGRIISNDIKVWKKIRIWYIFIPIALFFSRSRLKQTALKIPFWFNNSKSTHYQCYNVSLRSIKERFKKSDCEVIDSIEFEGHILPVFHGFHNILKEGYGNYMKLPVNKHTHGSYVTFKK